MRVFLILPLAALVLAACASPRERCLRAATADLRVIDELIAETEGNIARGYAIDQRVETRTVLELCAWPREEFLFCTRQEPVTRERPRAIDMAAEQRKLADLRERRQAELRRAAAAQAACPAA